MPIPMTATHFHPPRPLMPSQPPLTLTPVPPAGKCRHCHTRAKYLRGQSSFDSGSAARGWGGAGGGGGGAGGSPGGSTGSSPNNSSSSSCTVSANNSDGDGGNSSSSNSSRSSSSSGGGAGGGGAAAGGGGSRLVRQVSVAETRRRSRSMDRYEAQRITGEHGA